MSTATTGTRDDNLKISSSKMTNPKRRISEAKEEAIPFDFKTMNPNAKLRPELKESIQKWILSFYHLDPRYKILTFFNLVASEGADNVTDDSVDEVSSYNLGSSKSVTTSDRSDGTNQTQLSGGSTSSMIGKDASKRENYRVNANLMSRPSARHIRPSTLSLLSSLFNATSILTVWRPCSNDAMRKMMEGTGVGKGLDIKGKSAKKGILSAFVPFLQIFHNEHKYEIQSIGESAEMRIYYKDEELREYVFEFLQKFLKDGPPKKKKTNDDSGFVMPSSLLETSVVRTMNGYEMKDEAIISCEMESTKGEEELANQAISILLQESSLEEDDLKKASEYLGFVDDVHEEEDDDDSDFLPPHKDPDSLSYLPDNTKLKRIRKYAKTGYYGIECSQRLFWYATVHDADITRVGTGTETGRPSLPQFQDANHKTLKVCSQIPKPDPLPVVLMHKSLEDVKKELQAKKEETTEESDDDDGHPLAGCLDPRFLVIAYEEQGTIKPVVSDFDGFLLGWRREALWFGCNLPKDQESLMMWCVDHIEEILDDQKVNANNSDTWTIRWLDVLKKAASEGVQFDMPEYGYGDPKSTSIMEHAALKLQSTGAVRHGSECFNYNFPQEIDETFLLISDTLKPVPWKYVNVKDLQTILSKKIAEGFVFPLNPKWILCDPGWKKIYDELIASDALYATLSIDVWFPPYTGIRERIEKIHKRHPNGFQRCSDPAIANRAKFSTDRSIRTSLSGRRQSATNILRETIDDGLGSELTGNAFADLAQLELDDFVGRTSMVASIKKSRGSKIAESAASLIIEEVEEEDNSNSESGGGNSTWRTPSKSSKNPVEKRPSTVSHSSARKDTSDKRNDKRNASDKNIAPSSNRSIAEARRMAVSTHSSASSTSSKSKGIGRAGRRMISRAAKSTRNMIVPGKSRSRPTSNLNSFGEDDPMTVSAPHSTTEFTLPSRPQTTKKYRYVSDPLPEGFDEDDDMSKLGPKAKMAESKIMNREPRRHFNKWNKIKENLNLKSAK